MEPLFNRNALRKVRKDLRKHMTQSEHLLWARVRDKNLSYRFYRQCSIGSYVVDFYCPKAKLIVELDGSQHVFPEEQIYDTERTKFLESSGFIVLRFWNDEVTKNLPNVISRIKEHLPLLLGGVRGGGN